MTSVQVGAAASTYLFGSLGVAGTTWLRLSWAAALLLRLVRPPLARLAWRDLAASAALGVTTGLMTLAIAGAIDRVPLGTAVAVEFLGPLGVAALRGHRSGLLWAAVALLGVLALTRPWSQPPGDRVGLVMAAAAAVAWAGYIVLTAHVGDRCPGLTGVAVSVTVAALVVAPPYAAEMAALRILPRRCSACG